MSQAKSTKGDGRVQTKKLVDLVQREIDDGATSVEKIHKAIVNLPLDVLERLDIFEEMVKGARKVQEATIGSTRSTRKWASSRKRSWRALLRRSPRTRRRCMPTYDEPGPMCIHRA